MDTTFSFSDLLLKVGFFGTMLKTSKNYMVPKKGGNSHFSMVAKKPTFLILKKPTFLILKSKKIKKNCPDLLIVFVFYGYQKK